MKVFYLFYTACTVDNYVCHLITKIKKLVLDDRVIIIYTFTLENQTRVRAKT